jgi:hypothetical protein
LIEIQARSVLTHFELRFFGDVYHVISEFGAVNLFGKNLQERALAMISIAHPDFRDELLSEKSEPFVNPCWGFIRPTLKRSGSTAVRR